MEPAWGFYYSLCEGNHVVASPASNALVAINMLIESCNSMIEHAWQ